MGQYLIKKHNKNIIILIKIIVSRTWFNKPQVGPIKQQPKLF
jgi:hypothetical protein